MKRGAERKNRGRGWKARASHLVTREGQARDIKKRNRGEVVCSPYPLIWRAFSSPLYLFVPLLSSSSMVLIVLPYLSQRWGEKNPIQEQIENKYLNNNNNRRGRYRGTKLRSKPQRLVLQEESSRPRVRLTGPGQSMMG